MLRIINTAHQPMQIMIGTLTGYIVRSSRLFVDESIPGGMVDLRLRDCVSGPHGTPVDAADRE